jgi:hypothetical protein
LKYKTILKKVICVLLGIFVYSCTAACTGGEEGIKADNIVVTADPIKTEENVPETIRTEEETERETPGATEDGIDVDLTVMSATMVYSEVYNMCFYPENYIGKTVRMSGMFSSFHDDVTGKDYFACIISDATACCSQGIEFVPEDEYRYPDDYPAEGDEFTVEGVFDIYMEGDSKYCTLREARFIR